MQTALEQEVTQTDFWQDRAKAEKKLQQLSVLKKVIDQAMLLRERTNDAKLMLELLLAEGETLTEITKEALDLEEKMQEFELGVVLSGPYDRANAILELHPGAGGVESQDWAQMLLRMYLRWAEKQGYTAEILSYLQGEEAGLKSVTVLVKGEYAYGYLKAESGVHRLVRISPFDASGRRHTSFGSVQVLPEIEDDLEVEIKTEDLRIDVYRASGAGGQHVNTTDSAVRIKHLPTGIVVTCQAERSQLKNKERALKILRARLHAFHLNEQQKKITELKGEQTDIGWGSQIRSYVFHPYTQVKDHRTEVIVGNAQRVLDGELQDFMLGYLLR
ncbi:MAG: peptide chain release factor 2 [Bacillota bacterium]